MFARPSPAWLVRRSAGKTARAHAGDLAGRINKTEWRTGNLNISKWPARTFICPAFPDAIDRAFIRLRGVPPISPDQQQFAGTWLANDVTRSALPAHSIPPPQTYRWGWSIGLAPVFRLLSTWQSIGMTARADGGAVSGDRRWLWRQDACWEVLPITCPARYVG